MPRKRKKSSHHKPPLVFTESPVNKQRNVPTPVYCAQHPISVPRQSAHNMSWVSPQFSTVPGTIKGQRRARRRRVSPPSLIADKPPCTCHGRSNSKSPRFSKLKKKSKFPSLQFVGERTPTVTVIQDVSLTDSEDDSTKENLPKNAHRNKPSNSNRKSGVGKNPISVCDIQDSETNGFMINPGIIKTPELVEVNPALSESLSNTPCKKLFTGNSSFSSSKSDYLGNSPHKKRKGRLKQQLIENLMERSFISTQDRKSKAAEVLVTDTPEAEYGLNTRVRRLRRRNILRPSKDNIS